MRDLIVRAAKAGLELRFSGFNGEMMFEIYRDGFPFRSCRISMAGFANEIEAILNSAVLEAERMG